MSKIDFMSLKTIDFCDDVRDGTHDSPKHLDSGKLLITSKNIKGDSIDFENASYISEKDYNKINERSLVEINDVLYSMIGTVGLVYRVDQQPNYAIKNMGLFKIHDELKSKWLYYYLNSPKAKGKVLSMLSGSTQKFISLSNLRNLEIEFPQNIDDAKRIIKICESIDKKIKLNNKINNNLFELMKRTYIEWFKNYNIPNVTFELKDSELGKIPCGWNIKHLKDVFFFQEGPGIRNWQYVEKDGIKFINIRCIKDNDLELDTANMISNEEAEGKYKHFMLNEWDVVVSTSGTLGRNQIIRKEHLPLCLNTSVIRFKPINGFDEYAFMYNYLISDEFLNLLDVMATGSAQRNFGPMHLNKIDLVYPDKDIIKKYNDLMFPVIKNIQNNKAENMKLSQLRDTLLPKLMNGEIDLDNIEV